MININNNIKVNNSHIATNHCVKNAYMQQIIKPLNVQKYQPHQLLGKQNRKK